MIIALNKPFGVLSQFTNDGSKNRSLAEFNFPSTIYPIGRLDADSEGLLLLTDESQYIDALLNPKNYHNRTYLVQVENIPTAESLKQIEQGVFISGYKTRQCIAKICEPQPNIKPRVPPIRVRKNIPDCWIELTLTEGKNRQVRKMTAAIGFPTLRLIRISIGKFSLGSLEVGKWKILNPNETAQVFE